MFQLQPVLVGSIAHPGLNFGVGHSTPQRAHYRVHASYAFNLKGCNYVMIPRVGSTPLCITINFFVYSSGQYVKRVRHVVYASR